MSKPAAKAESPLSETAIPKVKTGARDDILADLRSLAEENPERVISRNWYRINGTYAESAWNCFFGTFAEFKRQAGIVLSRQQHGLERAIAKHASVDHYRKLNIERADFGGRYVRDNKARFKTIVFASDLHDVEMDPFFGRVLIDTVKRVKPDVMSLVGDVFDLPEFGKYAVDPREWDVTGRIKCVHDTILRPLRAAAPESQFDLIEGNHEFRLCRTLADQSPALKVVLADLHGMTVSKLLGLDEFEVNYHAKADMGAYTKRDIDSELCKNHKVYYDAVLAYHYPDGRNMGMPGVSGHHHRHQVWPMFNTTFGAYEWHQMGAGHQKEASYCMGEKWHMGFCIAHIDTHTKASVLEYVPIGDFAVVGGKYYHREAGEGHFASTLAGSTK